MELLYNPELIPETELSAVFVNRQNIKLEGLIDFVTTLTNESTLRHAVIVGQRGMGKTTILLQLRSLIHKSNSSGEWVVLKFSEELYGISDVADLLVEVVSFLAAETNAPELNSKLNEVISSGIKSDFLEAAVFKLLNDWHLQHGKRLLLLIENLDLLIDQIGDEREISRFADILKSSKFIHLIGSSVTPLTEVQDAKTQLTELFQVFTLGQLNSQEIREMLIRRAEADGVSDFTKTLEANFSRLRALEHFTGGNPRLVLMLYHVLTQSNVEQVRRGIEKLLDEVTPYYKAKVETLPPQQRKILDYIAKHTSRTLQGVTPAEVAGATRLTPNQVSTQLRRLSDLGYIRVADSQGRNNYYTLSEPLYAIWYRMRLGRDERQRMKWLVDFVKSWYDAKEIGTQSARLLVKFKELLKVGELVEAGAMLRHMILFKDAMDPSRASEHAEIHIAEGLEKYGALAEFMLVEIHKRLGAEPPESAIKTFRSLRSYPWKLIGAKFEKWAESKETPAEKPAKAILKEDQEHIKKVAEATFKSIWLEEHDEALAILSDLEKTDFDRTFLWHSLAHVLERAGRYEEALRYAQKAESLMLDNPHYLVTYGELLQKLGRGEEALSYFERTIALDSELDEAWYGRGLELGNLGRHEEALKSFDRSIELNPFRYEAWFYRGLALQELGRYEEALNDYSCVIEIDPKAVDALHNRGWLLIEAERFEEALSDFDQALEINPELEKSWYCRGVALTHLERYDDALQSFDKAIQLDLHNADFWGNHGWVLMMQDKYEEAIASFDKALQINPSSPEAWWNRSLCLDVLKRYEEAAESFAQTLKFKPDDAIAWLYYGLSLQPLDKDGEALESFNRAIEVNPKLLRAWISRSTCLLDLGRYEDAVESCDRLLAVETDEPDAWFTRAITYIWKFYVLTVMGKTDLAAREWRVGVAEWKRALDTGRPSESDKRRWSEYQSNVLMMAASKEELRGFIRQHISDAGLDDELFPLARALDFLLTGDKSLIDRLSPEVRGMVQEIVDDFQGGGK